MSDEENGEEEETQELEIPEIEGQGLKVEDQKPKKEDQKPEKEGREPNNEEQKLEIDSEAEQVNLEDVPEEVKNEARKLGKGEPDAYYNISDEEYEKMKKHIPEDLQKTIASSEEKSGLPPQLWLPVINNLALGLVAFVPGLNIVMGAALYANLKILPKSTPKKVENHSEIIPGSFRQDDVDNGKKSFGTKNEDINKKESFGTKDGGVGEKKNFGTGVAQNKNTDTTERDTADNNPVLDSFKKVNQAFNNKASSAPTVKTNKSKGHGFSVG